jgi:hypothetical protein
MRMDRGGSHKEVYKMQKSCPHKMRERGKERLGLKVCPPRIRADKRARGKRPARKAYGILLGRGGVMGS